MEIHTLPLGLYQTNCYIVRSPGTAGCVIIDPGDEPERLLAFLTQMGLQAEAILLTHGHFDHVGAVRTLVQKTGCALWMGQGDYPQIPTPINLQMYPLANCRDMEVNFCEDGQEINAAGLCFTAMETPGHTWGSVCYFCGDVMFSGDTLFARSCGRTDLPGGDWSNLRNSLIRLKALPGDYRVYPGHGEETQLSRERASNPYL